MSMEWRKEKLGSTLFSINTHSISPGDLPAQFTYIDIDAVKGGTVVNPKTLSRSNAPSRARRVVREGDLLIASVRPYLRGFAVVPKEYDGAIASTGFFVIEKSSDLEPRFLLYCALSDGFVDQTTALTQGAQYPALNRELLNEIEISIPFSNGKPDLAEQKRIADRLEMVFAEVEKGVRTNEANERLAKSLGFGVARELLQRPDFAEIALGEVLDLQNGRAFKETDWSAKGLPIVRIQNLNNPDAKYNHYEHPVEERFLIDTGDLLIAWSGTPGTSFGAFIWSRGKAILNQHIFNAVPKTDLLSRRYLKYAVNEKLDEMIANSHGGAGLRHITKTDLVKVKLGIPMKNGEPDLKEQERLADELEKMTSTTNQIEQLFDRQQEHFTALRSSVLNQSFAMQT